jgi:Glycosyl transferase family 11
MISFRCGRLANRLVLFANFIAFAKEKGIRVGNPTFQSYSDMFEGTRENFWCQYPAPSKVRWVSWATKPLRLTRLMHHLVRYGALLNETLSPFRKVKTIHEVEGEAFTDLESSAFGQRIADATFVFVYGWLFRTPSLVKKHAATIREYFTPATRFRSQGELAVAELRSAADVLIGVHIRQGDYRRWCGGQYFFEASDYANWMRQAERLFTGQTLGFLVCSDEPRTSAEFEQLLVGFGPGNPVGDVYALSQCDYIIGPRSTFTQWAAFYGNVPLMHLETKSDEIGLQRFQHCFLDWPC